MRYLLEYFVRDTLKLMEDAFILLKLRVMDKLVPECKDLKERYDSCMEKWKEKPITFISDESQHACTESFEDYRACETGYDEEGEKVVLNHAHRVNFYSL